MNKPVAVAVTVAAFVGAVTVGVAVGRVMRDEPAATAPVATPAQIVDATGLPVVLDGDGQGSGADASSHRPTVADFVTAPVRLAPVIDPVAVGLDDSIGDMLVDPGAPTPGSAGADGNTAAHPPGARRATVVAAGETGADTGSAATVPSTSAGDASSPGDTTSDRTDDAGAPPAVDADAGAGVGAGADAGIPRFIFDAFDGSFGPLLRWFVDPCAGVEAGTDPADDCPDGYGATFGYAVRTPPPPFMFFARGHFLEDPSGTRQVCPAATTAPGDGQAAMTLFTRTPLEHVTVRYRRYGSADAWTEATVAGTPDDTSTWWMEQFEAREYDSEWGTTPICLLVDRDPAYAYEVDGDAVDVFDQPVSANSVGIVPLDDPTDRPPTTGTVTGLSSVATVTARTIPGGTVQFRAGPLTGGIAEAGERPCASLAPVTDDTAHSSSIVLPPGVYDPAYTATHVIRQPIPPGGHLLVCAQIFPDDNPLRPLATDRLLFAAPTQERPRIVLQGIRRFGESTIAASSLHVNASVGTATVADGCARWFHNDAPIAPGRATSVEHTLWECSATALPVDGAGAVDVPIRLIRDVPLAGGRTEQRTEEVAVAIRLQRCTDPAGCSRPREWYEVPIPTGDSSICGTSFGSGGCGAAPTDGIAVIRVEYPVVGAATGDALSPLGSVTLLDQLDDTVLAATPRIWVDRIDSTAVDRDDPFHRTGRLSVFTDRQMRMTATAVEEHPGAACAGPVVVGRDELATRFDFDLPGLCAGKLYLVTLDAADDAGNEFSFDVAAGLWVPPVSRPMSARVDLLGGPGLPDFGFIYGFGVSLDGQSPTAYWWDWSGSTGSSEGCHALAGTTARSRGTTPAIMLGPPQLDVEVRVTITTTGDGDCSGRPETGMGTVVVTGSFTMEQLLADEPLILETGPDAALPLRLTITMSGSWRSVAGS